MTTPTISALQPGHATNQFLIKISGVTGFWASKTGGEKSVNITEVYDGGAKIPDIISSRPTFADMTITRPYKPLRDGPVLADLDKKIRHPFLVDVQATDVDQIPIPGTKRRYLCVLRQVGDPAVNAGQDSTAAEASVVMRPVATVPVRS